MTSKRVSASTPPEWAAKELQQEFAITHGFVNELYERLYPHVAKALLAECAPSLASEKWIDAAYHALLAELPEEDSKGFAELEEARRQAKASLREAIEKNQPLLTPTNDDFATHTQELAQCVVSNWLAAIKLSWRRASRAGEELRLEGPWLLPAGSSQEQISRGLSAFAVAPETVLKVWQGYLEQKTRESASLPVSTRLNLATAGGVHKIQAATAPVPQKPGVGLKSDEVVESFAKQMLQASSDTSPTVPSMTSELELEADLSAGRLAAAAAHAREMTKRAARRHADAKPMASDPALTREFADYVLTEWRHFLELPLQRKSLNAVMRQHPLKLRRHDDKTQRLLQQRIVDATGMSWKRAIRIAKVATVYASAAHGGMVELHMGEERSKLAHYTTKLTGSVAPDDSIVGFAADVAQLAAVHLPGSSMLESQLQTRVAQQHAGN
jgi:hypothetical protein